MSDGKGVEIHAVVVVWVVVVQVHVAAAWGAQKTVSPLKRWGWGLPLPNAAVVERLPHLLNICSLDNVSLVCEIGSGRKSTHVNE